MPHHESPPPPKHHPTPAPSPLRAPLYTLHPTSPLATGSTSRILLAHTTTGTRIALKLPLPSTPPSTPTHEARILTHLTHHSTSPHFPRFHGLDPHNHALLLELLPRGTLRSHSLAQRRSNPGFLAEPVGGARAWLLLARALCKAFLELGRLGVVHGDVSWSNILLRDDDDEGGEARVCVVDYSQASMRGVEGGQGVVSVGFCAPEVLEGLVKGWEGGWGVEQDGYAVCMVLLACAVGEEVYGGGKYESVWARQGRPLEWVAGGDGGRVVRGVVGRVLRGCFGVRVGERVGLEEVAVRVEEELRRLEVGK